MKVTHTNNVYSMTLHEHEWFGVGEAVQVAIRAQAQLNAQELGCRYISIMVQPDELFSSMPKRQQVWRHTFPATGEEELYEKLCALVGRYVGPDKLTHEEARAVARRVFG